MKSPKVAIVADWLTNMAGAEKTVLALAKAFPKAPIFTSVYDRENMSAFAGLDVRTTYLQKLPKKIRNRHQLFPLLRANAFRALDLSQFDVIISSASAEAKAVRRRKGAVHICYCHTPTRYYWSHYKEYLATPGFGLLNPAVRVALPVLVKAMRKIDLQAVEGVDHFIANSHEVQQRIKTYYKRDSTVIFPPVETNRMKPGKNIAKEDFYLVVGRQIPYKRIDLAVQACTRLNKRLVVIGRGSEHEKLKALAGPTIEFIFVDNDREIVSYFQRAKAFIFPSFEDFGITPVEAMAAGTPVLAYQNGGALDYVHDPASGIFFKDQTVDSLCNAIKQCEKTQFNATAIATHAESFSESRFIQEMQEFVEKLSK